MSFTKKLLFKSAFILSITLVIFVFGLFPELVLSVYSKGLYPIISSVLRWVTSLFPYALGDILYAAIIIYILRLIVQFFWRVKKKGWQKTDKLTVPIYLVNALLIFYISFKLLWGLNYSRPPIAQKLGISDEKYSTTQLVTLGKYFLIKVNCLKLKIDSTNCRPKIYTTKNLSDLAILSYQIQAKNNNVFNYPIPSIKSCLFSNYVTKSGIEGYYNFLSGEANVNMDLPVFTLPFTICHEIAHQTGVAKEDEANLLGYITASKSNDVNFQYAGYYSMFRNILFEIRAKSPDDYQMLFDRIAPTVLADFKTENEFWLKNNSSMSKYMGVAFDRLLKFNNQKKGIKSYQDIVLWLYNYHKKDLQLSKESFITIDFFKKGK